MKNLLFASLKSIEGKDNQKKFLTKLLKNVTTLTKQDKNIITSLLEQIEKKNWDKLLFDYLPKYASVHNTYYNILNSSIKVYRQSNVIQKLRVENGVITNGIDIKEQTNLNQEQFDLLFGDQFFRNKQKISICYIVSAIKGFKANSKSKAKYFSCFGFEKKIVKIF